ncbi:7430_t:CDS:2 [Entrophospora sp. SA101]|nr:7430_t:CDS:2 [Entrophospora sp. SA101]
MLIYPANNREEKLVGYDSEKKRVYSFDPQNKELFYSLVEKDNIKNYRIDKGQEKQEFFLTSTAVPNQTKINLSITITNAFVNENNFLIAVDEEQNFIKKVFILKEIENNIWKANLIKMSIDENWIEKVGSGNAEAELTKLINQNKYSLSPVVDIAYSDGRRGKEINKLTTIKGDFVNDNLTYIGINEADQKVYLLDSDPQQRLLRVDKEEAEVSKDYNFKVGSLHTLEDVIYLQIRGGDKERKFEEFKDLPLFQNYSSLVINIGYNEEVFLIEPIKGKFSKKKEVHFKEEVFKHYKKIIVDVFSSDVVNNLVFKGFIKDDFEFSAEGSDCIMTHKKTKSQLTITRYEQEVVIFFQNGEEYLLRHNELNAKEPNLTRYVDSQEQQQNAQMQISPKSPS